MLYWIGFIVVVGAVCVYFGRKRKQRREPAEIIDFRRRFRSGS